MPKARTDTQEVLKAAASAALDLAADGPWETVSVHTIAERAGCDLSVLYDIGGKPALLEEIDAMFDRAMGAGLTPLAAVASAAERRSRLADVMMQRFDAMERHRDAVASIDAYLGSTPGELAKAGLRRVKTAQWALQAAGVDEPDIGGRALALAAAFLRAKGVWRRDAAPCDATMAAIDRDLRRYADWMGDVGKVSSWVRNLLTPGRAQRRDRQDDGTDARPSDEADPDQAPPGVGAPPPPL